MGVALAGAAASVSDLPPDGGSGIFDEAHIKRISMGDAALEAEILQLFVDHLPVTFAYLSIEADAAAWTYGTHTIKGGARGVGAVELAGIAALAEQAGGDRAARAEAMLALGRAIDRAKAYVDRRKAAAPMRPGHP